MPCPSKWDGSGTIVKGGIVLDLRQILRHQIFRWLRDAWERQPIPSWTDFVAREQAGFAAAFLGKPIARTDTRLGHNLEYVLRRLAAYGGPTVDVLLYFHHLDRPIPTHVVVNGMPDLPGHFRVVAHSYEAINPGGFFSIQP
jgi:hypothetical protein